MQVWNHLKLHSTLTWLLVKIGFLTPRCKNEDDFFLITDDGDRCAIVGEAVLTGNVVVDAGRISFSVEGSLEITLSVCRRAETKKKDKTKSLYSYSNNLSRSLLHRKQLKKENALPTQTLTLARYY